MFNGYAKMRLLDTLIGRILDIHQTHWMTKYITGLSGLTGAIVDITGW